MMRPLAALPLLVLLLAAGTAAAAGKEFPYVDEDDPAAAEKLLDGLLKKYDTPREAERLIDLLAKKRPYPSRLKDSDTLTYDCLDGKSREFTYILPRHYSPARPVGILVWLHGAISQPSPGGGANEGRMFAPAVEDLNVVVIGPSTYDRVEWGTPACRDLVRHAVDYVKRNVNVDEDRVWIAGDSDGGRGTYAIPETMATTFAAAVPVIGAPGGVTRFVNLRNLPWLALNGETDGLFKIDQVRSAVDAMKKMGIDVDFRVFPGVGHDPRLFQRESEAVCKFLAAHPRDPFPKKVEVCVDPAQGETATAFPANTVRWLRIEEVGRADHEGTFDEPSTGLPGAGLPRVAATRDGNRIDVTTRGVKRYTVLLASAMVNLGEPVTITTNGRPSFTGKVEADPRTVLEEARRFRDRKLLFAARVTVDVDADPVTPAGD